MHLAAFPQATTLVNKAARHKGAIKLSLIRELQRRNVFRVGIAYAVVGWLLLQVTDIVVPILGLPPWVARLVLFLLALGFPLALFFAWVYELTPQGLKREREIVPEQSITRQTGRKLDRAIIAILVIAMAWFGWDRYRIRHAVAPEPVGHVAEEDPGGSAAAAAEQIPVVAVLPFKATGSDDGGFLASGLHDDLLTRLAKLGAFRVISRTSMMEYADTTKNMRRIGEDLGAGYILEGGVQAIGERVRINAQLIDAPADEHIWAEVYNRELSANSLFDVQAELAVAIAKALQTELSPADLALVNEVPTENIAAYNAYLRGRKMSEVTGFLGTQRHRDAVESFEEAVRLDPDFALAWALLATARIREACWPCDSEDAVLVLEALNEARRLQPGMLESELVWAEYLYRFRKEYAQALLALEALGKRANGNLRAMQLSAFLNRRLGHYEIGYQTLQAARRLQPRTPSIYLSLTYFAWLVDDCAAAAAHADNLLALAPDSPSARVRAAQYELECTGDAGRAVELVGDVDFTTVGGNDIAFWAAWLARDTQLAIKLTKERLTSADTYAPIWQQLNRAAIYRYLEPDEALAARALAKAAELLDDATATEMAQAPTYAALKANYHCLNGDVAETREWIEEHKRRYREEFKGDVFEEANSRFNYAWAYACAGLHEEAIEELRVMLEEPGGHRFPYFDGAAPFDELENYPAYIALRERFGNLAGSTLSERTLLSGIGPQARSLEKQGSLRKQRASRQRVFVPDLSHPGGGPPGRQRVR
jgi:TolB-like protein